MIKTVTVLVVLFVSFQLNAQWVNQTSGVSSNLVSVSAVDNNVCWISGDGGVILRTIKAGTKWANVGGGSVIGSNNFVDNVYALDANNCIAAAYSQLANSAFVYRTTDGGSNWTQVFSQSRGFIDAIRMTSATDGFMVGDPVNSRWSLWRTNNGGASWDSTGLYLMAPIGEYGYYNSLYTDGSNIWFGTNTSKIYYSSDNGTNWTVQASPVLNIFSLSFSGNIGIAAGSTLSNFGDLAMSTNNGTTWTEGPFAGSGLANCTSRGNIFLYTTLTGAIYLSTNYGVSFTEVDSVSGIAYGDVGIARNGTVVWACGAGGRIRVGSIRVTAINDIKPSVQSYQLEQNYPNPFNPSTTIIYTIGKPDLVKIGVYNTLGQLIKELVNEVKKTGSYSVSFNASSIASGIYFYKIETPRFSQVKKMILLK